VSASDATPPTVISLAESVEPFTDYFNRADVPRVLIVVSPT